MLLASVILRDSVKNTDLVYTYKVPLDMSLEVLPGQIVEVPFGKGNNTKDGIIKEVKDEEYQGKYRLKELIRIKDTKPVMNSEQLKLIDYISQRYVCTMGDAISLMVPSAVANHENPLVRFVKLADRELASEYLQNNKIRSINQINILTYLFEKDVVPAAELLMNTMSNNSHLTALKSKGLIDVFKDRTLIDEISEDEEELSVNGVVHELNSEQQNAVDRICEVHDKARVFLLHGITGSGKTEVFLRAAQTYLERGQRVLYLVPEISLTPQTIRWITSRFNSGVAVLHSRLTDKQRYDEWNKIRNGEASIIVAARSGVFAPIDNLKLIIIDEEHDTSYMSDSFQSV